MNRASAILIFCLSFLVLLFFSLATHPFEVPDEQSHYATVHFLVNEGILPKLSDHSDLSLEEEKTEYLLGIMSEGNNKYSYHPEFRLPAGQGNTGLYEVEIKSLNQEHLRRTYTIHQAAIYPPLYYVLAVPFYWAVKSYNILDRLYSIRLFSVILTAALVVMSYQIGRVLFQNKRDSFLLAAMTLLFPMTTYIGSGVNSDNLHNLLFTIFLYLCFKLIRDGWGTFQSLATGIVISLDILTKPQAFIMLPILLVAVFLRTGFRNYKESLRQLSFVAIPILLAVLFYRQPQYLDSNTATATYSRWANFQAFVNHYMHLIGPMLVWHWGIFKWFGLVLPKPFWWSANRLVILSGVGMFMAFYRAIKQKQLTTDVKFMIFSILANFGYVVAILWFDWQFYQRVGRSLGVQPRYFMPLIVSQMYLILVGLLQLTNKEQIKSIISYLILIFFVGLHLAGLYTQLSGYYSLISWQDFLNLFSQYKPYYAKSNWWYLWISLYLTGIIGILKLSMGKI